MQRAESEKLLKVVAESSRALNAEGKFSRGHFPYLDLFRGLLEATPHPELPVLDYGCGAAGGISTQLAGCVPYDPFVPEFAADPWAGTAYRAIYSADVLEHMTTRQVISFLTRAAISQARLLFLVIATRPASKVLLNGANVHLIVEPPHWWYGLVQGVIAATGYECALAWGDFLEDVCVLAFRSTLDV